MVLHGNIEQADRQGVRGWVRDPDVPETPVSLLVMVDNQMPARVMANVYRVDLEQAGLGAGRHGFMLKLEGLSPLVPHTLGVVREADGAAVPGSPVTIQPCMDFNLEVQDHLAKMLADASSDEEFLARASFLAQQANRLLQLRADRRSGNAERIAQRQFRIRWSGSDPAAAAIPAPRALVIDDTMPDLGRDAGSHAIVSHMKSLQRLGYSVVFAPADMRGGEGAAALEAAGVATCTSPWSGSVEELLHREAGSFSLIYFHRAGNARYLSLIRHHQPRARVIYSVADLHHVRLARQAEVEQRPELLDISRRVRVAELSAANFVDCVITHSTFEAALLKRDLPNARVHVVPWSIPAQPVRVPFDRRHGMAFIGSYGHPPNLDAAWWLILEVMPLVRELDPAITCILAGSGIPHALRAAAGPGLEVLGHVSDLGELFNRVRLTVAPLTFGAGVKGKVLDSFAAGVPCACSPVAAEGLDLPPQLQAAVAEGAPALARVIHRLHADAAFNAECAEAGLAFVRSGLSEARLDALMRDVVQPKVA